MERYFPLELYGETYYVFVGSGVFTRMTAAGESRWPMIFRSNMSSGLGTAPSPYISDPGVPWRPYPDNVLTVVPDAPEISSGLVSDAPQAVCCLRVPG